MATTGTKFMQVTKATTLVITSHATQRIAQCVGIPITRGLASALFHRSRHVRYEDLYNLGYRPAYVSRMSEGERSWYFMFHLFGQELIAVLTEGDTPNEFVWVTTYAPSVQTEHYRLTNDVVAA